MKNLKGFNLKTEYNENNMPYPGVSYVNDEEKVYFEKESYIIATYSSVINNNIDKLWRGGGYDAFYLPQCGGELIDDFFCNEFIIKRPDFISNETLLYVDETSGEATYKISLKGEYDEYDLSDVFCGLPIGSTVAINKIVKIDLTYVNKPINNINFSYSDLRDINFGNNVKSIAKNGFHTCDITELIIPESITSIEERAFRCSYKLTSITIHDKIEYIGDGFLAGCSALTSVNIADNPKYVWDSENRVVIETETNTLISGFANSKIPNTIKIIGKSAFDYIDNLTNIVIPNSVEIIDEDAFLSTRLSNITIPNSVKRIEDYAFYLNYRSNATQINFEENSQLEYIGDSAFNVDKLTSVEIPNSVKHIGNNNFYNTYSLSSITIQEDSKLEYIGASTFGYNYNLKTFTLPKSVIKIGDDYIVNTEGVDYPLDGNYLETLYVDKDNTIYNDGNGSNCIIETATNTLLVSTPATTLPSTVTRIGDHAYDCIGENYVTSEMINIVEGIEYIGHEIIDFGTSQKTLYLPSTLKEIASRAFIYCDNLTEVISKAMIAPEYSDSMFYMNTTCVLKVPQGAIGYDAWIEKLPNWTIEYITE